MFQGKYIWDDATKEMYRIKIYLRTMTVLEISYKQTNSNLIK